MASGPRITYSAYIGTTPVSSFEARWDNIHVHRYPELHGGAYMGANLRQIDLTTGRSTLVGTYELNIDPKFR